MRVILRSGSGRCGRKPGVGKWFSPQVAIQPHGVRLVHERIAGVFHVFQLLVQNSSPETLPLNSKITKYFFPSSADTLNITTTTPKRGHTMTITVTFAQYVDL